MITIITEWTVKHIFFLTLKKHDNHMGHEESKGFKAAGT